jgi:hypothetical protein
VAARCSSVGGLKPCFVAKSDNICHYRTGSKLLIGYKYLNLNVFNILRVMGLFIAYLMAESLSKALKFKSRMKKPNPE